MKTAAIYTRVSSEGQRENKTIGSQVDELIQFAGEVGYVVPEPYIFKDEGYSGAILIRPGLEKVRDLSAEGRIQAVLIHSPDRLSRNYAYQVVLLDEFNANGTEVLFVSSPKADTPEQALLLQFQGMISEYERAMITERSRRGKRFKAKTGVVNVLGGAPYGYTYIKKTEESLARYEINEEEALTVKEIFRIYTEDFCGIGAVARTLSSRKILTRTKLTRWERSVVWSMLRNPAYCGKACFGKTERAERQRITKPLRANGGYVVQNGCNREKPREEWIEIPVPAIITQETFDMAQERLKTNKQHSRRNTNIETLLQSGIMVCRECGYSLYRTYTTTSAGNKIFYYRCFGSDPYRFEGVRKCNCKPFRQDYIDNIVWEELVRLIQDPRLILSEIERRVDAAKKTNPLVNQKALLEKQRAKGTKSIDKLLDAYQEGLIPIGQLRKRMPDLQKKVKSIENELKELKVQELALDRRLQLLDVPGFTEQLGKNLDSLDIKEKKKILRLLVKEIIVGENAIEIVHSVPLKEGKKKNNEKSYQLCTRSNQPFAKQYPVGCTGQGTGQQKPEIRPLC